MEDWKQVLIGQLDNAPRLKVSSLIADPQSTYDDIVRALRLGEGDTSKSAAQRFFKPEPDLTKFDSPRKGYSVVYQWAERITEKCETKAEVLAAMSRARIRSYLVPQLRTYLDNKQISNSGQFFEGILEG